MTPKSNSVNISINNIRLKFETVKDDDLLQKIICVLTGGVPCLFDHVYHYKQQIVDSKNNEINVDITGIARKSL